MSALPETLQTALAALQAREGTDQAARTLLAEALHAANEAGWTYRQLGEALGVSRSFISARINAATGTPTDFGFEIPPRTRAALVLEPRELPREVREDLESRLARALSDRPAELDGLSPAVAEFFQGLRAAVDAGWDPAEIAGPLGMTARAVSRFVAYHGNEAAAPAPRYPSPPARPGPSAWNARYRPSPPVLVPEDDARRLQELAGQAYLNRGVGEEAGARGAAAEYTALIACWYLRGASRQELERATGQGWEALRKRLSRWGYMSPPKTE